MRTKSQTIERPSDKTCIADLCTHDFRIRHEYVENPYSMTRYHYHNQYEIYYLQKGERFYFINDKVYHIKKGALVFISPYTIHATAKCTESSYSRILIEFSKNFIRGLEDVLTPANLFDCFEKDIHIISFDSKERQFVEPLLFSMLDEYTNHASAAEPYEKVSMAQLLLYARNHAKNTNDDYNPAYMSSTHKLISEITGYINNHYGEEINLSKISDVFHISPCHFSRTFKTESGIAFSDYLNNVRIKEACELMYKTDMTISDIAFSVGYKSCTHFGRIFKKLVGTSPLTYKKELNK